MTRYNLPEKFENLILPPKDNRICHGEDFDPILKKDGMPRITSEGLKILIEGFKGDFSGWVWEIGNHPLEIPYRCCRNVRISASYEGKPHFWVQLWFGLEFPVLSNFQVIAPHIGIDELDDLSYFKPKVDNIQLGIKGDWFTSISILLDDRGEFKTKQKAPLILDQPKKEIQNKIEPHGALDKWLVYE